MGFFNLEEHAQPVAKQELKGLSIDLLHKKQCAVCPLNMIAANKTPHMQPQGSKKPLVYMLGEAPTKEDDRRGNHFTGQEGRLLRNRIP
jgi:uracil-DNA glycosylase